LDLQNVQLKETPPSEKQSNKRKPTLNKKWFWVFIIIVSIFVLRPVIVTLLDNIALGLNATSAKLDGIVSTLENNSSDQATSQSPNTKTPTLHKIGDSVSINDVEVTINGARVSEGNKYDKPKNEKYLIIDATVENKGTKPYHLSMLDYSLYDSKYIEMKSSIFSDTSGRLSGEIAPGRKIRGEVAYDVTKSDYYDFIYGDSFETGQVIWRLNEKDSSSIKSTSDQIDPSLEGNNEKKSVENQPTRGLSATVMNVAKAKDKNKYIMENYANLIKSYPDVSDIKSTDKTFARLKKGWQKDSTGGKSFIIWPTLTSLVPLQEREDVMFRLVTSDSELQPIVLAVDSSVPKEIDAFYQFADITFDLVFDLPDKIDPETCKLRVYEGKNYIDLKIEKPE